MDIVLKLLLEKDLELRVLSPSKSFFRQGLQVDILTLETNPSIICPESIGE